MDNEKWLNRRIWFWVIVWLALLFVGLALLGYWEMGAIRKSLEAFGAAEARSIEPVMTFVAHLGKIYYRIMGAMFIAAALFLGLSLRLSLRSVLHGDGEQMKMEIPPDSVPGGRRSKDIDTRRHELHLLALLQRDGRLVDFLEEDLQAYDDQQIGAAVRTIQEKCKKALNRYVNPRPILDREEGQEVTVPEGFDPGKIKVTGNVSGSPPFVGTLQHRGWRAGELNLPVLSGEGDPDIIAPAEVEVTRGSEKP
ncbi:MAG: DUF2760 domain-containing protein [Deltaproteobacteria bacterium]|nr:DUF2760 domain-containing protein [Deltaproteobacteria bacterium]MBW2127920.1 DUF2760 domain-containing protein [Deltaproteobacteria bacterium]MBW2304475.1 DUF2760 domain-containing protein [Deltaproteobacteria bacterium]